MQALLLNRRLQFLALLALLALLLALLASVAAYHALHPLVLHHLQGLADGPDVIVHNH